MAKSDLFDAIRKNSLRQITLLLESGSDVNSRNGNSETPLMVALYQLRNKEQRERAIKQLLVAGADVNARNGQGRTPLLFACALDQPDSIRLLLQKEGIDVNQGDVSGVTPLMLSAALGHRAAVTTLMEFARAGHVRLDTQAKDDSDFTALDYAAVSGNAGLADQIRGRTKSTPAARLTGNKLNNNNNKNINNNNAKNMNKNSQSSKPYKAGEEDTEEITASALRDSNLPTIQQFARDLKARQAQNDTNLVALASSSSSSSSTSSRPGSRNASSATPRGRPLSQERASSRVGSHSKERPASRVSCKSRGSSLVAGDDDDDVLDLDLSSLRDLMGTVREAAKEIREIVEPMQREQEEAARPQEQRKRRSKKGQHHSRDARRRDSGHRQQIQAEIHVISEINGRPIPPLPPATPLTPSTPPLAPSAPPLAPSAPPHDTGLTPPTAFLHVENEELSHTWPRQKGRSVSRERSLSSGSTMPVGGATSEGNTPLLPSKYLRGPAAAEPHARVSPGAAESERQILDKVVGRQYGGPDPLVAAINSATFVPKSRLIMESRQRVVGRAREHWSIHQPPASPPPSGHSPLPHITISQHAHHHHHHDDGPRSPVDEEAPPVDAAGYAEGGEVSQAGPQPGGGPGSPGKAPPTPSPRVQPRGPQTAGQAEQRSSPTKASGKPAPVHTPAPQTGLNSAPALQTGPKSTPALPTGPNKPAPQTGPNKPAPQTGLNKTAPQTGPNKPAPQTGPNKPAPQTGPNKPEPQTGPNKPAPQTGPNKPAPQTGPIKPAPQTSPNKPAPQTGPNKPAAQTGPNSKPAAQTGLSSRTAPQTGASNKPVSKPAVNAETNGRVAGGGPAGKAGGGPAGKAGLRRAVP